MQEKVHHCFKRWAKKVFYSIYAVIVFYAIH